MGRRTGTGPAAVALLVAGLLAACSTGSATTAPAPAGSASTSAGSAPTGTAPSGTTTAVAPGSSSATASPSATRATGSPSASPSPTRRRTRDRALEGTWHADAGAVLTALLGIGPLRAYTACAGPVVLTFTSQGTVTDQGQVTCTGTGPTAHGQFSSTGRFTADGSRLVVTHAVTRCTLSAAGAFLPCGFATGDGTASYRVSGTHLTVTVGTATGTRTQPYVR